MKQIITDIKEIENISGYNRIILEDKGSFSMNNSEIVFSGENNILYCERDVRLDRCKFHFEADNSVIYLSWSSHKYRANITVYNNCSCYIGEDGYFNSPVNIICSEERNVFIGRQALISTGVWIRIADPHLVFSAATNERINPTKSVYIGDHVWIGQNVMIFKGTHVHSGSILGGGAVLAGQKVPSNTSYAGNPARQIAQDIFWDETVVHRWTSAETEQNKVYQGDKPFIFEKTEGTIPFARIDKALAERDTAKKKLKYITKIAKNEDENRFAWRRPEPPAPPDTLRRRIRLMLKRWILRILK